MARTARHLLKGIIAKGVASVMKDANVDQKYLAGQLDRVSQAQLSKCLSRQQSFRAESLAEIAQLLDISVERFFPADVCPTPSSKADRLAHERRVLINWLRQRPAELFRLIGDEMARMRSRA